MIDVALLTFAATPCHGFTFEVLVCSTFIAHVLFTYSTNYMITTGFSLYGSFAMTTRLAPCMDKFLRFQYICINRCTSAIGSNVCIAVDATKYVVAIGTPYSIAISSRTVAIISTVGCSMDIFS